MAMAISSKIAKDKIRRVLVLLLTVIEGSKALDEALVKDVIAYLGKDIEQLFKWTVTDTKFESKVESLAFKDLYQVMTMFLDKQAYQVLQSIVNARLKSCASEGNNASQAQSQDSVINAAIESTGQSYIVTPQYEKVTPSVELPLAVDALAADDSEASGLCDSAVEIESIVDKVVHNTRSK